MSEVTEKDSSTGFSASLLILIVAALTCGITGYIWYATDNNAAALVCLLSQTVLVSILIWQACDPFAEAAQFIGMEFRLPGSVRGATLDAVASSMPELFTGIFFVVVLTLGGDVSPEVASGGEGFASTIATCAGSAVYNMILIPAICAIFISFYRKSRPTIDVDRTVILRDGFWFVGMEVMLIVFLLQQQIHWWMGIAFLASYGIYVCVLFLDARRFRGHMAEVEKAMGGGATSSDALDQLKSGGGKVSRDLARRFGESLDEEEEELPDSAEILFGWFQVPLNHFTCWIIILLSTAVAATACYWLVEITTRTAERLEVDIFFVAVILAAAASSVPDTFLSIGSAKKGDDDGAVSNAFGSNIFDISICISIPLLVASYLNNWQPITLEKNGAIVGLQIMLAVLTAITLGIIWHKHQLTRTKAIVLCALYGLFILYAVLGSQGFF